MRFLLCCKLKKSAGKGEKWFPCHVIENTDCREVGRKFSPSPPPLWKGRNGFRVEFRHCVGKSCTERKKEYRKRRPLDLLRRVGQQLVRGAELGQFPLVTHAHTKEISQFHSKKKFRLPKKAGHFEASLA